MSEKKQEKDRMEAVTVRPKEMIREIKRALRTLLNVMVLGKPGIGKTEIPALIARQAKIGFKRIVLPQFEEVDFRGVPEVNERKRTVFYPTEELPYADKDGDAGILLLDELPSAKPSVQIVAHQLLDSRKIGSLYELPKGWIIVVTGNRQEDYAFVYELPTTVRTRLMVLTLDVNFSDWQEWAYESQEIEPEVIAFLKANPGEFENFEPTNPQTNYALPRTWHMFSKKYYRDIKQNKESLSLAACVGLLGEAAGNKFHGWAKVVGEMPDIDGILVGTESKIPTKLDVQYCVTSSLTARLIAMDKEDHKDVIKATRNVLRYVANMTTDLVMAFINDVMQTTFWKNRKKDFLKTTEFAELSKRHARAIVGSSNDE